MTIDSIDGVTDQVSPCAWAWDKDDCERECKCECECDQARAHTIVGSMAWRL